MVYVQLLSIRQHVQCSKSFLLDNTYQLSSFRFSYRIHRLTEKTQRNLEILVILKKSIKNSKELGKDHLEKCIKGKYRSLMLFTYQMGFILVHFLILSNIWLTVLYNRFYVVDFCSPWLSLNSVTSKLHPL